ncbi:MAG: dTMP kinase [Opitutales bacterium]|nr:dTMP kinase [Opitutales bacterium]NRA27168.1 dTMP kinase [Opitutales bacterium]
MSTEIEDSASRGIFISFEGAEGSGKSTQISRIARLFEKSGEETIVTREPGGTEIGEEIRHLLKHSVIGRNMCSETELLLFAAARAQLVRETILPALEDGKTILSDRFLDSTTVYQGVARQLSEDPVKVINEFAVGSIVPDLTIILDVPPEVSIRRVRTRKTDMPDRMEEESIEFYKLVREGYLVLSKEIPERFVVFDGTMGEDAVEAAIWDEICQRFASQD